VQQIQKDNNEVGFTTAPEQKVQSRRFTF